MTRGVLLTSRRTALLSVFVFSFFPALVRGDETDAVKTPPPIVRSEFERRVVKALDLPVSAQFIETPLDDAVRHLSQLTKIDITLDKLALENVGLDGSAPVTLNVKNVSFRSLLNLLLTPLNLSWDVHDEAMFFTSQEAAEQRLTTRVYHVLDLIQGQPQARLDADSLISLVTGTVAPSTWDEVGGPGSIQAYQELLIISQTRQIHSQISQLFGALRQINAKYDGNPETILSEAVTPEKQATDARLFKLLESRKITLDLIEAPLDDVVRLLAEKTKQNVVIDASALDDIGVSTDATVSVSCKNVSVHSALRRVLSQLELTFVFRNEVLLITTPEMSESRLATRLYPVRDLVTENGRMEEADYDSLIALISTSVAPEAWEHVGGPGAINPFARSFSLVVSQTDDIHAKTARLLSQLRATRKVTTKEQRKQLREAAEKERARIQTAVYTGAGGDGKEMEDLTELTREFLSAAHPKKKITVRGIGNHIVVQADAKVQIDAAKLLQKFGAVPTKQQSGFGGGVFGGGGGGFGGGGLGGGLGGGGAF